MAHPQTNRSNPPCPHLPRAHEAMNNRCLTVLPKRSSDFYLAAQRYGNFLWQTGHAGRAVLAITRSLYTDLQPEDPIYRKWPLPYASLSWIFYQHPSGDFPGNPRISFQHQATRLRSPQGERNRARAWAAWALIRQAKPQLPGDPNDPVPEPSLSEIKDLLESHGHPGEASLWQRVLDPAG